MCKLFRYLYHTQPIRCGHRCLSPSKVVPQFLYDLGYVDVGLMVYAPAAFIVIGIFAWVQNELILRSKR